MAIRVPLDAHGADEGNEFTTGVDFQELWQHRAALHDICQRIVGDAATADDVVQETYMRALRNLDRLERRPSLMPWLATVARRRSIDELRRRRYQTPVDATPDESTKPEWDPGESVGVSETVTRVREALTTLTPRERDLLMRQVNHGLSLAEIADQEDSTVASVRSVLSRARSKLRTALVEAGMQVLAPVAFLGSWMRRKAEPVANRAHQAAAVPIGYERFAEGLVAGVAAVGLTFGGFPGIGALGGGDSTNGGRNGETATVVAGADALAATDVAFSSAANEAGGASRLLGSRGDAGTPDGGSGREGDVVTPVLPGPHDDDPSPMDDLTQPATRDRSVPDPDPGNPFQPTPAETPDDTTVSGFSTATDSEGNYSVYAVGSTCGDDSCTVLWRSSDGGRSWTRLKADGLRAHTILVPANSDGRKLFAVGATGVQVSDDGGKHFHQALAASYDGPAAVSPAYNQTPTKHLYLGAAPNWTFDAATEVAAPLAMGLPGNLAYFAFDPQFATNERMYAGTTGLSDDTPTVFVCDDGWCAADDAVALPELDGTPRVAVPKSDASLVFAWYGERMYRSPDAGVTFAPVTLPLDGRVTGLSDNGAGTIFASVAGASDGGGVVRSHDGGVTWTVVGSGTSLVDGADAVVATADRVYAAPRGGGIMCSRNDGITWSDRC